MVQEVILGRDVKVRKGLYEVEWGTLAKCFHILSGSYQQHLDGKVTDFIDTVDELKSSRDDPANGLLDLAIRFRTRVAGNPRDKLLGFVGLLKSPSAEIAQDPYRRTAPDVFAHFAGFRIQESGSLAIMALAENRACHNRTWAVDWTRLTAQEWKEDNPLSLDKEYEREPLLMFWNGGLLPSISASMRRQYSAAQDLRAICREEGPCWKNLYLTGWQADAVKQSGKVLDSPRDAAKIIKSWEKLAGGPWANAADSRRVKFIRTLVADAWQGLPPSNWLEQYQQWLTSGRPQVETLRSILFGPETDIQAPHSSTAIASASLSFERLITACCYRRRFFITEGGRFGLGPSKAVYTMRVCLFLGASVPFILLPDFSGSASYFVGQAYVDGLMNYKGTLAEDLKTGKVTTTEFLIQ